MSKSTAPLFGRLLRECRKRVGLSQRALPSTQAPQDAPPISEKAQEHSSESFTDTGDGGIISPPMPHNEVEYDDHLTEHISDLQQQTKLRSETKRRPSHYPHGNVVDHVAQLRAEAQSEQAPRKGMVFDA